ncbi:hypothetical protein BFL35_01745 [Clavibacter michiganensis]|nr:hypothetical protein BFL35_01745 [Clavibacter michiganensis]
MKPPYAPRPEIRPSAAAVFRCVPTSPDERPARAVPERSANTAGIMRYVAPLPMPLAVKSTRKSARKSGKLPSGRVMITATTARPITTNAPMVTAAPPCRSARRPPNGRATDPMSDPRNASDSVAEPTAKVDSSGNSSEMSFGKTPANPMNEPKVPT